MLFFKNKNIKKYKIKNIKINVVLGNILNFKADAIINPANPSLLGGGGLDGLIHRNAPEILEECKKIRNKLGREAEIGEAFITSAGKLKFKYIIHAIGPIFFENENIEYLSKTYINCIKIAEENNLKSISFPNISTGKNSFPKEIAAREVKDKVLSYLQNNDLKIKVINFVCFDKENYQFYLKEFSKI